MTRGTVNGSIVSALVLADTAYCDNAGLAKRTDANQVGTLEVRRAPAHGMARKLQMWVLNFHGRFYSLCSRLITRWTVSKCHLRTRWSKNGYQFYFCDNFGNSALILTILSLLQADIHFA